MCKLNDALQQCSNSFVSCLFTFSIYFNLNKIEVVFEDLDYKTYKKFIEDKIFTQRLHEILKFYLDKNINYVLTFLVRDPEKVTFINSNSTRRLGLDIWCKS